MNCSRGASFSLINQLPTYTYSAPKANDTQATPEYVHMSQVTLDIGFPTKLLTVEPMLCHRFRSCLVCRCSFSVGEEIKSLPCFHSYHSECIDSWLCLNKVCPVCQFSIDHAHPST